ncbi:MAG: sensor histidine kinase [Erysipelotrichaceae bacterium]|nr:sensor histidine kinase [Erysipelotrichaceae bacterium]MDY5251169.1 sensor histidine kinase [Erysipelotrichaceae bacterium]
MKLKTKILIAFIICILIICLPLYLSIKLYVEPQNKAMAINQFQAVTNDKSKEIGSWLNQRISEIRVIHEFEGTQNLDMELLKPFIENLNNLNKEIYGNVEETYAIGGTDGIGWINDDLSIDISNRDYFKEAMSEQNEYVISDPVISKSDGNNIFLICYPIINQQTNKKVGFINGSITLDKLNDVLSSDNIYNSSMWIMTDNGLIYSNNIEKLNLKENEIEQLSSGNLSNQNHGIIKNNDSTIFFSKVPYSNKWVFCQKIDNNILYHNSNQTLNIISIIILLLIIMSIIIANILAKHISKPIVELKQIMDTVVKGNFDIQYKTSTKDEICSLGMSFNKMIIDINKLFNDIKKKEKDKRIEQLRALQAQINPHFLYNTLDTIQFKAIEYNAYEVSDMIYQLSNVFRIGLSDGRENIEISEEISHVVSYLSLQEIRYDHKFTYHINCDPNLNNILIPKLILQPLVENSLTHGIRSYVEKGVININIRQVNNDIEISVIDNGKGISAEKIKEIDYNLNNHIRTNNYGLYNINERLFLNYNDSYKIDIFSIPFEETKITIIIPIHFEEIEHENINM